MAKTPKKKKKKKPHGGLAYFQGKRYTRPHGWSPKFADMNPGGRPRIYKTPAELAARCLDYFERSVKGGSPFGIFILCVHLGMTYVTFLSYERGDNDPKGEGVKDIDKFSYVLIQARIQIAASSESRLMNGANAAGPIFHLQQISRRLGEQWKNVGSSEVTGKDGKDLSMGPTIVLPDNSRGDLYVVNNPGVPE